MSRKPIHIVHLGMTGFPHGFAAIQRILLLFKGLQSEGAEVFVINRKGKHRPDSGRDIPVEGVYEGIPYIHTSGYAYRPDSFMKRTWLKLQGLIGEYRLLKKLKKQGKLDIASVYINGEMSDLVYYWAISRIIGFKTMLSYVECWSGTASRSGIKNKINDYLYDKVAARFTDAMLPISDYLYNVTQQQSATTPQLKVPIIGDFDRFDPESKEQGRPHFLYCGSTAYIEVVEFILDCFSEMKDRRDFALHFVLGGPPSAEGNVRKLIENHPLKEHIFPHFNIPGSEIPVRMVNATALLIPMRNTIQDAARFPHKIGEYLASGNPIVSCNVGEIKVYFEDKKSAIIADSYDIRKYAAKMQFVVDNPQIAIQIGEKGRQLGLDEFDYRPHGRRLKQFAEKLLGRKTENSKSLAEQGIGA